MNILPELPLLDRLSALLPAFPRVGRFYLVGGAVRDALLGFAPTDLDFTSEHDPTPLARELSRQCGGHWFWLDEQRRQSRVVQSNYTFDFAPWRASTLAGDLAARDFTVNAMALDLAAPLSADGIIDPLGGKVDLAENILRAAGPGVLRDDPLRILRGIRQALELEFEIADETLNAMRSAVEGLQATAPERLRIEVWKILAASARRRGVNLLHESGAGDALFGRGFSARLDVVQQELHNSNRLFVLLAEECPLVAAWLKEPVEQGLDRGTMIYWCLALGAIADDLPLVMSRYWRFSHSALVRVAALQHCGSHLWDELIALPLRPRPVALWASQQGPDPIDLLLWLGTSRAHDNPDRVCRLLSPILNLLADHPRGDTPPLVSGNWLRDELGLEGADIGKALAQLRSLEICGTIVDAIQARQYLVSHFPEKC